MYKKSLIILSAILFFLCICTVSVFANNGDATNNVKNTVTSATDTVIDGVSRMGSDVRTGISNAENSIEDTLNMNNNDAANNDIAVTSMPGDYTVTRAADTDNTNFNDNTSLWIWMIIAIAGIVIITLVWYYGTQNRTHHDE